MIESVNLIRIRNTKSNNKLICYDLILVDAIAMCSCCHVIFAVDYDMIVDHWNNQADLVEHKMFI